MVEFGLQGENTPEEDEARALVRRIRTARRIRRCKVGIAGFALAASFSATVNAFEAQANDLVRCAQESTADTTVATAECDGPMGTVVDIIATPAEEVSHHLGEILSNLGLQIPLEP